MANPDKALTPSAIARMTGLPIRVVEALCESPDFPAPLTRHGDGLSFDADEVKAHLLNRGIAMVGDIGRRPAQQIVPFNPLADDALAMSVANRLLNQPEHPLPPARLVPAEGLYLIHYRGDHPQYKLISGSKVPIYCGKAMAPGGRKGNSGAPNSKPSWAIYNRLRRHADSLSAVERFTGGHGMSGLRLEDFTCRFLPVGSIWIPLAEKLIINHFQPVWNVVVGGFGNNDPGAGRRAGKRAAWDEFHPGRRWSALHTKAGRGAQETARRIQEHLKNVPTEDLVGSSGTAEETDDGDMAA